MYRRKFIQASVIGSLGLYLPLPGCTTSDSQKLAVLSHPQFLERLFDKNTLILIGEGYRKEQQSENDKNTIQQRLLSDISDVDLSDKKATQSALDYRIKLDFIEENTIVINGWILSVTEARQCALFSMVNK